MADFASLVAQSLPKPYQPTLGDDVSALFRAAREGTSVGTQRDRIVAGQNQMAQQKFANTAAMMDMAYKQLQIGAAAKDKEAVALKYGWDNVKEMYKGNPLLAELFLRAIRDDTLDGSSDPRHVLGRLMETATELGMKPTAPESKQPQTSEYERLVSAYEEAVGAGNANRASAIKRRMDYLTTKGEGLTVNVGTDGSVTQTAPPNPLPPEEAPQSGYEQGTGMSGFAGRIVNSVTDWMGLGLRFPDVQKATNAINRVNALTNTVMAAGVPGRPSDYVRVQFEKFAPKTGMGDATAKEAVRDTLNFIRSELTRMRADRTKMTSRANLDEYTDAISNFESLEQAYSSLLTGFDDPKTAAPSLTPEDEALVRKHLNAKP